MRILFDKGTPRQLRSRLVGHQVELSPEHGWDSLENGDLLDRAEEAGFDVLLTTDQNIRYQQNLANRRVSIVVLMNTAWWRIARHTETVRAALDGIQPGEVREVHIPMREEG